MKRINVKMTFVLPGCVVYQRGKEYEVDDKTIKQITQEYIEILPEEKKVKKNVRKG